MTALSLARLTHRKLLRVSGPDTYAYLQGLVSNDLRQLYENHDNFSANVGHQNQLNTISSYILNAHGRAICDILIYRTPSTNSTCSFLPPGTAKEPDELLIECDSELSSGLANTLWGYRIRRKIAVNIQDDLNIWALYPEINDSKELIDSNLTKEMVVHQDDIVSNELTAVKDPRLSSLGLRILSKLSDSETVKDSLQRIFGLEVKNTKEKEYNLHRYKLGVGEGPLDHPEADCLPLECNADYLNSVSFNKGCYLGQELTARIHFTGVIRKRLMPISLEFIDKSHGVIYPIRGGELVNSDNHKKVGKIRNILDNRGLALIRTDILTASKELLLLGSNTRIKTYRPYWWS